MPVTLSSTTAPLQQKAAVSELAILNIPLYVYAVTLSSVCILVGIMWDISWHTSIGRDAFFSPPHVLVYLGAVVAGIFSGGQVLWNSFGAPQEAKNRLVKIWGIFYSSLGALFCIWGAFAMLTSAPFDDWWHNAYGLDLVILSPPHTLLGLGMMVIQFGACVSVCQHLNSNYNSAYGANKQRKVLQVLFIIAAACLLTEFCVWSDEYIGRRVQRTGFFYQITAIVFLLFLPALGKALRLRWGMTWITLTTFFITCCVNWILQLVPATPKLGPVLTHVTHLQPLAFPLLLFVPAFAMDIVLQKVKGNDWQKAARLSIAFVLLLLAVHYPFGRFLTESPMARNWFFGSETWYFGYPPDYEYRYQLMPEQNLPVAALLPGIGIATGLGFLMARVGLRWGNWFQNIER